MPAPSKTIARLAVKFVEFQGKRLLGDQFAAEVLNTFAETVGDDAAAKLAAFFDQGERAEQLLAAFQAADDCLAAKSDAYAQLIRSKPLARIESLEKLATALPDALDHTRLLDALRRQFLQDWQGQLTDAQAADAANAYTDCLIRAFALKFGNDLPLLIRIVEKLDHLISTTDETLERVKRIETTVTAVHVWQRPSAPRADPGFVGRAKEREDVRALLAPGTRAAITATVHGTPGVGKTWLARQLAAQLDSEFPGGVLFQFLGSTHRRADLCAPILDDWSKRAGYPLARDEHLSSDQVRDWLDGHGPLLVVLDDVWDAAGIKPLLDAAPRDASILLTTRKSRLAREASNKVYALDILTLDDALDLLRARMDNVTDADAPLLGELAGHLGRHAQALDIAGKNLSRWQKSRWKEKVTALGRLVRAGEAFGELPFPGEEERVSEVEAALKFSYDEMDERAQTRFRALGAFAPDASFRTEFAAALWKCPNDEALGLLTDFCERGLLSAQEHERWQQHLILHAYALALLRRAGEEDATRRAHAETFLSAMREMDDKQVYYRMLPDYAQLRHAFEWAVEHDLGIAQGIAANGANLQSQFNLVRDSDAWSLRLLELARQAKDEQVLAQALLTRGNILSDLANLPGEDRAARLRESLAAYDEALRFRRPDTAPLDYAMTQGNLAILFAELADMPGEDQHARLREALRCAVTALGWFEKSQHAPYVQQARGLLEHLRQKCGDLFPALWAELNIGALPAWLQKQ